jgi:hypothetical protein
MVYKEKNEVTKVVYVATAMSMIAGNSVAACQLEVLHSMRKVQSVNAARICWFCNF